MNDKSIVPIILIVVLVILIGAVGFLLIKGSGDEENNNSPGNNEDEVEWKNPDYVLNHEELIGGEVSVKGTVQIGSDISCQEDGYCNASLILVGEKGGEIELGGVYDGIKVECLGEETPDEDQELECFPLVENREYVVTGVWMGSELKISNYEEYNK